MGAKLKEWTEKEKEILFKYFPSMGCNYCSNLIGRTKRACQEMAKKLKLERDLNKYEDKEKLEELVKSCKTYTDCVIKLGLSPRCSGNFQTIKKYIMLHNIDISHFENGFQIGNNPQNKKELSEVLVENSFFSRSHLKERLYKEGLKKKECEICGMGEDWFNGTKIVHILDHINGEPYDNRLENLRIVCPNCNSTLETNCVGNKVNKIYDSKKDEYKSEKTHKKCNCGKIILKESKFCLECNAKSKRKVINRPTFEELVKLIEENGNTGTGKIYGVSESVIRKWLKQYKNKALI